jgi:hypothetical protein
MEIAKRGKLLTYDTATGAGLIAPLGSQAIEKIPFTIEQWNSNEVPRVGMIITISKTDSQLHFTPLSDTENAKEKLTQFGRQLYDTFESSIPDESGARAKVIAGSVINAIGKPALVAYSLFFIGTIFFNFMSVHVMGSNGGTSLWDLSAMMSQMGGGGSVKLLLFIAFVSVGVPFFWKDAKAWLAYCVPLFSILYACYVTWSAVSDMKKKMGGFLGSANLPSFSDFFSFSGGFYITAASGLALATLGTFKFLSTSSLKAK